MKYSKLFIHDIYLDPDLTVRNNFGFTPLQTALACDRQHVILHLL